MIAKDGPFYFGPPNRRLFGWYHRPADAAPSRDVAIVVCSSFGYEAICQHRAMRHFAEDFARAGFPVLRFDYDGAGDSAGSDRDPDRVPAWISSIHQAIDVLKTRSGVKSVCLLATRLGATLAAAAAGERDDCSGLIAVAPVLSPAHYLRELAAFHAWGRFNPAPDGVTGVAAGDQEASGFVITAATAAALAALDVVNQPRLPAAQVLVLERDRRASSGPWIERLVALGAVADSRFIEGYAEMSLDPHKTVVPGRMIAGALEWLESRYPSSLSPQAVGDASVVATECELEAKVAETPVFVNPERTLFGVLTHSKAAARTGRAIILLNAGSIHRVGPNRLWTTFARDWARTGAVVLRLDLSGLGDSPTRDEEPENFVYANAGVLDIADAVEYLRREWGVKAFDLIGFCGGGYQAMKAAAHGVQVDSILSINQQVYFWDPACADEVLANNTLAERWHGNSLLNPESWKKFFRGGVQWRLAVQVVFWRALDLARIQLRNLARALRLPLKEDLATELRAVASTKARMRFIFSDGEVGGVQLFELAGATARRLERKGALSVAPVPGTNHIFTAFWMHRELKDAIEGWLGIARPKATPLRPRLESHP